jgi:hypothetical protein
LLYSFYMEDIYSDAKKLLSRNRIGALLRIFAHDESSIEYQMESGLTALSKLAHLELDGKPIFSRIDFLVSGDQDYVDSGVPTFADILRKKIEELYPLSSINVLEIKKGDIYTVLLNYGIANQLEDRVTYSAIISHNAHEYITTENISAMLSLLYKKNRAVGLAVGQVKETVEKGHISNTFSIWHNKSLISVGGMNLFAMQVKKHQLDTAHYIVKNQYKYPRSGCEHIIPLVYMSRIFGKCLGVVIPPSGQSWSIVDKERDDKAHARHLHITETFKERELYMASLIGGEIEEIEGAVQDVIHINTIS